MTGAIVCLCVVDRCHVEEFMEGEYVKHNNNAGWVNDVNARNTPNAFSHFTFEVSNRQLLVCDIQGVSDIYTDPQVHSVRNLDAFGRGNLGKLGINHFIRTHQCNALCQYLKLHNCNQLPIPTTGTVPQSTLMEYHELRREHFDCDVLLNEELIACDSSMFPDIE